MPKISIPFFLFCLLLVPIIGIGQGQSFMQGDKKNSVEIGYRTNIKEHGVYLGLNYGHHARYLGQTRPIHFGLGVEYYTIHNVGVDARVLFSLKHDNICMGARYTVIVPRWYFGVHYKFLSKNLSHAIAPEVSYHFHLAGYNNIRLAPSLNYFFEIGNPEKQAWYYGFYPSVGLLFMF